MSHLPRGLLSEDNDDVRPPSPVHLHSYVEYDLLACRHWQLNGGLFCRHWQLNGGLICCHWQLNGGLICRHWQVNGGLICRHWQLNGGLFCLTGS
jgi:hypothetical protein